jgi:hypothetical protein
LPVEGQSRFGRVENAREGGEAGENDFDDFLDFLPHPLPALFPLSLCCFSFRSSSSSPLYDDTLLRSLHPPPLLAPHVRPLLPFAPSECDAGGEPLALFLCRERYRRRPSAEGREERQCCFVSRVRRLEKVRSSSLPPLPPQHRDDAFSLVQQFTRLVVPLDYL